MSRLLREPLVRARHRGLSERDVIVGNYPRSGSTWLTIMVTELLTGESVDERRVGDLAPGVGRQGRAPRLLPGGARLLRTHEPYRASYRRAVYLVRDPRDVVVSYYHFQKEFQRSFDGDLHDFVRAFAAGRVDHYGGWEQHVLSWLEADAPLLVLRYEDLLADTAEQLGRALAFMGVDAPADRIRDVVAANGFERMRQKEHRVRPFLAGEEPARHFVRMGVAGDWRNRLSAELVRLVDEETRDARRRLSYPDA